MAETKGDIMKKNSFYALIGVLLVGGYSAYAAKDKAAKKTNCEEDGQGIVYCLYENGKPVTGKIYTHNEDGGLASIENFKDGYRDGLSTFFDSEGKYSERLYYKRGLKNGMYKKYYDNRTKQIQANYADGLLDGQVDLYFADGKLSGRMNYRKGKLKRGFCADKEGKKTVFGSEELSKYQDNNINMCGM